MRPCLGPLERPSRASWRLPDGSWDMHFHVLGPQSRYPYAATRNYTPPDAPLERVLRLHATLGIARGLVVHANTHGFDNAVDLDAVRNSSQRYLAVVRLDASATPGNCRKLHDSGARGVRFAFNPKHGGTLAREVFDHVVRCIRGLGWFVELHFEGEDLPALAEWIAGIPATVVIDHFGRIDASRGVNQAPWRALEKLVGQENVWIKISGADRISAAGAPYADVVPFAHRLLELAPGRLVWGSDWPHTGYVDAARMPDDGKLADALLGFVPDERLRKKVLVDNPLALLRL